MINWWIFSANANSLSRFTPCQARAFSPYQEPSKRHVSRLYTSINAAFDDYPGKKKDN